MITPRLGSSSFAALSLAITTAVSGTSATGNVTTANDKLVTWWHDNGEINYQTPVKEGNVRQSHLYSTWVKSTGDPNGT